jgi:hypothetical protein
VWLWQKKQGERLKATILITLFFFSKLSVVWGSNLNNPQSFSPQTKKKMSKKVSQKALFLVFIFITPISQTFSANPIYKRVFEFSIVKNYFAIN